MSEVGQSILYAVLFSLIDGVPFGFFTLGTAIGNTIGAIVCAFLLDRVKDFKPSMERTRDGYGAEGQFRDGLDVWTPAQRRIAPNMLSPRAKTHNYLNMIVAEQSVKAHDPEGAYDASLAHITEVRDGILRALEGVDSPSPLPPPSLSQRGRGSKA